MNFISSQCTNCLRRLPMALALAMLTACPQTGDEEPEGQKITQSLSFQDSADPEHTTDKAAIVVKVKYSSPMNAMPPTAPTHVTTAAGSQSIVWKKIDAETYEGTINLKHSGEDQEVTLKLPSNGLLEASNQIKISYKTKYKQFSFGLELELKRNGVGRITRRDDATSAKKPLVEKTLLARSQIGPKKLPFIKLVTDDVADNEACIEVVSGPLAFGFKSGDANEQQALRFKRALNLLIDSLERVRSAVQPDAVVPLFEVVDHYNGLISREADHEMRKYHLEIQSPEDGSLFFIEGRFRRSFLKTPQVNWAFPLSRVGEIKPGAANEKDPTYFSDMFGQVQEGQPTRFRRRNLILFQQASQRIVKNLAGSILAGASPHEQDSMIGALTILLWESLSQSYRQCAVHMLEFGQAQDPASAARGLTPASFRDDITDHPAQPGWSRVIGHALTNPLWILALPNFDRLNSMDHGAGKNIYDNLPKACLEDIAQTGVPDRFKVALTTWWEGGGENALKAEVHSGKPIPGFERGFSDDSTTGPEDDGHGHFRLTTPFYYCDNWLFAMVEDVPYDLAIHKRDADEAMWGYFGEKLHFFGRSFFHYRNPGNTGCQLGTSRDSEIKIENLGEGGAEPSIVFEMRNTHPLDQFDYTASDQAWRDTLVKWRHLLKVPQ